MANTKGSKRKYVDRKCQLCLTKFVLIDIYIHFFGVFTDLFLAVMTIISIIKKHFLGNVLILLLARMGFEYFFKFLIKITFFIKIIFLIFFNHDIKFYDRDFISIKSYSYNVYINPMEKQKTVTPYLNTTKD